MASVAVVIPCYRVKDHILEVISRIGPEVATIFIVDDKCPMETGRHVEAHCKDPRVEVIYHRQNLGVGGATMSGYLAALSAEAGIVVKIDGDGQMDPSLIPSLVAPIVEGATDYVKGNRFFSLDSLIDMPRFRLFGNSVLSFVSKITSGYWNVMDPTNGFTAIHADVLRLLPFDKLDNRYFFESDMLFRLGTLRAVVKELPMIAQYGDEASGLRISRVVIDFPPKFFARFFKRMFYLYYLRDFTVCSLELIAGTLLMFFGGTFGIWHWYLSVKDGVPATTGTVMVAALPVILGFQLLLSAVSFDVMNVPKDPLHLIMKMGISPASVLGMVTKRSTQRS